MGLRSGTNEVLVSLETDSGGVPGAILESIDVVGAMSSFDSPSLVTATSVLHSALVAGTPYWLVVSAPVSDTSAAWFANSTGAIGGPGTFAFNQAGSLTGPWLGSDLSGTLLAFQIDGLGPAPVPEPASVTLPGIGAAGMIAHRWQTRKKQVTRAGSDR